MYIAGVRSSGSQPGAEHGDLLDLDRDDDEGRNGRRRNRRYRFKRPRRKRLLRRSR